LHLQFPIYAHLLLLICNLFCIDIAIVINEFPSDGKSKKAFESLTQGLKLVNALIVEEKKNGQLHRAVRNLDKFDVIAPEGINVESVLRRQTLVLTVAAAKAINEALLKPRGSRAQG